MSIQKTLLGALTSSLLFGTSVWAQETENVSRESKDPFEVSHEKCEKNHFRYCGTMTKPGVTVREYIVLAELSSASVLAGNDWTEEMLDAEIPVGKFFFGVANPN